MNPLESALQLSKACELNLIDLNYLAMALIHPSYAQEQQSATNNQRLEFLGDAILDFVVADYLYRHYKDKAEGDLTRIRARVVCEQALAEVAHEIDLGRYILLGRGEESSGGRQRRSILGDTVEAVIGALYLDQGMEAAAHFVIRYLETKIIGSAEGDYQDYKSRLQELAQSYSRDNVHYEVLEENGPPHARSFEVGVFFRRQLLATGSGNSKKEAEQIAAGRVLADEAACAQLTGK